MPVPLQPVRPGDLVSAATFNQVVDALNALGQITGAYPIEVAHDASGVRIALAHQFKAWLFCIQEVPEPVPRTADGVTYYRATRLRLDSDDQYAAQSPQDVTLYDPLAKSNSAPHLAEGDWVLATFDADAGRWHVVRSPANNSRIVRFRLSSTLDLGGSAPAVIRKWDPAAGGGSGAYVDGDTITVKDYFGALGDPGEWQAPNGYYGFAVKLTDLDEYQILYMEHQAAYVAFTLTSDISGGEATADFDSFWAGRNVGTATNVFDRTGNWSSGKNGQKGIACWDSKEEEYVILALGKPAQELVLFYLDEDLEQFSGADATLRRWVGANWVADAGDAEVWDSSGLGPALQGDVGVAFLSSASGRYEIITLQRRDIPRVVRFKLYEALTLGGNALAKVQTWGGAAYADGDEITVVDWYGFLGRRGAFQAPSGFYGYAIRLPDKDEYQILELERQALFAEVHITEDMGHTTPGQASASFDTFWEGQSTAGAATVFDTRGAYGAAKSGDKFLVVWDSHDAQYKIADGKPGAGSAIRYAKTYDSHTLAADSKSNDHYVECQACDDITGAGYDSGSEHFNVLLPSPSAATDPNVESGVVIGYTIDDAGNRVCVTGYLDDARKTLKLWHGDVADIPHGWTLCDGTSGTPDLSGRFVIGGQTGGSGPLDDDGNSNDFGETGGRLKHKHAAHQPAATTSAAVNVTSVASTAVNALIKPTALSVQTVMTGSPIATGTTLPTKLEALNVLPVYTVVETSLTADHHHEIDVFEEDTKKDSEFGVTYRVIAANSDPITTSTNIPSGSGLIQPNPHTHDLDIDSSDARVDIDPNPHVHGAILPVSGITFSPDIVTPNPHNHDIIINAATTVLSTADSHSHMTPTLSHSQEYHTPRYYALAYIMRTE